MSQRTWLERRSRAAAMPYPSLAKERPSGITFAAPPATAQVMGGHLLPAALIATSRIHERSDWPALLRRIGQQPLRRIYEAGHPRGADDRGRILGSGRRPVRGSTTLQSIPTSSSIRSRVDGMHLQLTLSPTASSGPSRDRFCESPILPGRRSDRRLHIGFKIHLRDANAVLRTVSCSL